MEELADPSLERKYDANQMDRLILTASYCVRQSSIWRPSMAEVHLLHAIVDNHLFSIIFPLKDKNSKMNS